MKKFLLIIIIFCNRLSGQDQFRNAGSITIFPGATLAFFGNFTNDGTLADNGSSVSFTGGSTQLISGTSVTTFNNLLVDNASGAKMFRDVVVNNSLTLSSGQLDLNSNLLTINNNQPGAVSRSNGYILSEQADNSGRLKWNIGSDPGLHIFPFGTVTGNYVPFSIKLASGNLGNVMVSTYPTAQNNTPYPVSPDSVTNMYNAMNTDNSMNVVDRFWQIEKDSANGTADITFAFTPGEAAGLAGFTAQRWNSAGKYWEAPLPGQTSNSYSVAVPGVTTFSTWAVSSSGGVLPLEVINFSAKKGDKVVNINWETESENNSDFFTVEKTSDGAKYEEVTRMKAAGNSRSSLNYFATDPNPYNGISYYRLKQTDLNGKFFYSELVDIEFVAHAEDLMIYPNPVNGNSLSLTLPVANSNDNFLITLEDALGKKCYSAHFHINGKEESQIKLDFSQKLNPGIYLLIATCNENTYSKKIVIE